MPTMGLLRRIDPVEPKNLALPKAKIPPSVATSQYPLPSAVPAMPTMGLFNLIDPVEPRNLALPKLKIPPSEATSQYPLPGLLPGGAATPVPDRLEDGRVTPLATTVRLEDRGPMVVGLKETDTVQLPASGTVAPVQVSLPMMKAFGLGWPSVTEFTVTGAPVTLVRLKLTGLVTWWMKAGPKAALGGPKVGATAWPTPVRIAVWGVALSFTGTATVADLVPVPPGLNWMVIVQDAFGPSVDSAVQVLPANVKSPAFGPVMEGAPVTM